MEQNKKNNTALALGLVFSLFFLWAISSNLLPTMIRQMMKTCELNTFTASFTSGAWIGTYSSGTVPAGFLAPLNYINVGRPRTEDDHIAKVRLIVPHSQGHSMASSYVYPYYYEISFMRKTDL